MSKTPEFHLKAIFDADRALRTAEAALLEEENPEMLAEALWNATAEARALDDQDERSMRLERLADLCAQVPGPRMADALVAILNEDDPGVRVVAGEALRDVGYERYAEVARAIERAIETKMSGPALSELPWVIAEIGEPSAVGLIRRFLGHHDPDVIAAAVEALASAGDPSALPALEALTSDTRIVTLDDPEDETTTATLGELARAAIAELDPDR